MENISSNNVANIELEVIVNSINSKLKQIGDSLIRTAHTNDNQSFFLVTRKNNSMVLDFNQSEFDSKKLKIKFSELMTIGKELSSSFGKEIKLFNNGIAQGLCKVDGTFESLRNAYDLSLGYVTASMNKLLKEIGSTTVEEVYNGNNHGYLLVHNKGYSGVIHVDEMILDTRFLKIKLDELVIIGKELAQYEQTAVAILDHGTLKEVCRYEQDFRAVRKALLAKLFAKGIVMSEESKTELESLMSEYTSNNGLGGSLNIRRNRNRN